MGAAIYRGDVDKLEGHALIGDGECVALVQGLTTVGPTSTWRPGPRVVDLLYLNPGTVIANFIDGRFPNMHGYHAALFVSFGPRGMTSGRASSIVVMDQWTGRTPRSVRARTINAYGLRPYSPGSGHRDCDNADAFFVVIK